MKLKVSWLLPSESVTCFLPSFSVFRKIIIRTKFEQFSKCSLGEICSQHLKAHCQVWDNFWQLKALENDEKCFLFHLKSSFRCQYI